MRSRFILTAAFVGWLVPLTGSTQQPGQQPAQQRQPARPGVMVVSQNKCAFDAPAKIDSINKGDFYPILDQLVTEGRLMGWGVLQHSWGDEWNFVIYYAAANLGAFDSAFRELVQRLARRRPNALSELSQFCTEHKDSIYAVMQFNPGPAPTTR